MLWLFLTKKILSQISFQWLINPRKKPAKILLSVENADDDKKSIAKPIL